MKGKSTIVAAGLAFILVYVVVTNVESLFASLQPWTVITAIVGAAIATAIVNQRTIGAGFVILLASLILGLIFVEVVAVPLAAAVAGVVFLSALAAVGAGILFNSDPPRTTAH